MVRSNAVEKIEAKRDTLEDLAETDFPAAGLARDLLEIADKED